MTLALLHGTTWQRAIAIEARGPDADFVQPGELLRAENFSMCVEAGPFPLGTPEEYACQKANLFPNEGGAAIIKVEVPEDIVALATADGCFPVSQGVIQFDEGAGLEELKAAWPQLHKQIVRVACS